MTPTEARELFSDAYDGELDADTRAAFDAAVAADAELRADWERFRAALDLARGALGGGPAGRGIGKSDDTNSALAHVPNLLPGVQHRLRARSRGRYYANRYSERRKRGRLSPVYLLATLAVALVTLWLAVHFLETLQPDMYPM